MSPNAQLPCSIIVSLVFTVSFAFSDQKPTAYDAIKSYNLPVGTLPKGVVDYELNTKTGDFKVYFKDTFEVSLDGADLDFSVGVASANFPAADFEESPQCGCGFDCTNNGLLFSS
ncbi:hypothetical protein V5N11_033570 [Cardamine amara subsp. amara]|uniref:Uncharacterized protein n=1 Tax=Cardamine amara subsp. amara TaxID=228776 RepID=A0ABD1C7D1_CARAN